MNQHQCYRCRPYRTPVADRVRAHRALDRAERAPTREAAAADLKEACRHADHISKTHACVDTIDLFIGPIYDRMWGIVRTLREAEEQRATAAAVGMLRRMTDRTRFERFWLWVFGAMGDARRWLCGIRPVPFGILPDRR